MRRILIFLAVTALLASCVAAPAPTIPDSRGITGTLSGDIYIPDNLTVGKALAVVGSETVGGSLTVTGAIVGASFSPTTFSNTGDLTANTGNFTTTLTLASTPVARLSGSAIDAASLKVAATPVAVQVGALSAGQRIVCGTTNITGTGTLPTGLATPSYVLVSLAQDATGDCARLSTTNAAATVTAKCWNTALTPAAAATVAVVNWCVNGNP